VLHDAFERNVANLTATFQSPIATNWVEHLPASSEGRLLGGAGHTLRWGERKEMREIVDAVVETVRARQSPDGYCLPYEPSFMGKQEEMWVDERRNYDRVGLTRGLVAAGLADNADAWQILRRFYDWLYASPYARGLLGGHFNGSAHNCNNGHEGSLLMYFSPVGTPSDLLAAEKEFVQDFFIEEARKADPRCLGWYPLHTPHSYVLLAFQAWVDHYRATGAAKYLEAARGAWTIVHDSYEHVGGTIAICEEGAGAYPPGSYHLHKHTGETCGSVFWADFNHRLLQLSPDDEKYAGEIEKVILNVILAAQDERGHIRYHNHLVDRKDAAKCINTCCEVMGVPFIARLPQYIYSVAPDGLYINLFAPSRITWRHAGQDVTVATDTGFPFSGKGELRVEAKKPVKMKLRIRIPSWATGDVVVSVDGAPAVTGRPGTFASIERTWRDGARVSFDLSMGPRLTPYRGVDQVEGRERCALEYGPMLLALVGAASLDVPSDVLLQGLSPRAGSPLCFDIDGYPDCRYIPYWQVQDQEFTCFPSFPGNSLTEALGFMQRNAVPVTATVPERRVILEARARALPMASGVSAEQVKNKDVSAEWVSVSGAATDAVMLFIHGGGYVAGSAEGSRDLVARLCSAGRMRALSIDYRLAPESPFPAGIEDCARAYRWLLAQGVDARRVALVGPSSGGGLVAATLLALRDKGTRLPACAVCISPFVDMTVSSESLRLGPGRDVMDPGVIRSFSRIYLNGQDPRQPLASPIFADMTGLPPLLIQVGSVEVLLDEARALRARAIASGVEVTYTEWAAMFHGWHAFAALPEGARAIAEIGAFMREHCGAA
jgi:acetyl esterase/lipase